MKYIIIPSCFIHVQSMSTSFPMMTSSTSSSTSGLLAAGTSASLASGPMSISPAGSFSGDVFGASVLQTPRANLMPRGSTFGSHMSSGHHSVNSHSMQPNMVVDQAHNNVNASCLTWNSLAAQRHSASANYAFASGTYILPQTEQIFSIADNTYFSPSHHFISIIEQ